MALLPLAGWLLIGLILCSWMSPKMQRALFRGLAVLALLRALFAIGMRAGAGGPPTTEEPSDRRDALQRSVR